MHLNQQVPLCDCQYVKTIFDALVIKSFHADQDG